MIIDTRLSRVSARNLSNAAKVVEQIKIQTFDHFFGIYGKPNYIKIDVEGYEEQVILGLSTPIALLSFECNFPYFKNESINIINYLNKLYNGNIQFNISVNNSFLFSNFLNSVEMITELDSEKASSFEIFCKMK